MIHPRFRQKTTHDSPTFQAKTNGKTNFEMCQKNHRIFLPNFHPRFTHISPTIHPQFTHHSPTIQTVFTHRSPTIHPRFRQKLMVIPNWRFSKKQKNHPRFTHVSPTFQAKTNGKVNFGVCKKKSPTDHPRFTHVSGKN